MYRDPRRADTPVTNGAMGGPTHPAVSVLLPAFNSAGTLGACLASLGRQTLRNWECVLVDDGSTDATAAMAAAAAARDARIVLVRLPHGGIVEALNAGLVRCRAPLVARMDADDVMHRDRLAAQAAALDADPGLDAVGCHVRIFPRAGLTPRRREYEAWLNGIRDAGDLARNAFVECPVAHPSLVMRAGLAATGYRDSGWPEDYDFVLRALGAGRRIGVVPQRLLAWRDSPGRLSRRDARYAIPRFTACRAHHLAAGFLRGHGRYVLWGYGRTGRMLRAALAAHGLHPSHIVEIKRGRLGQTIHGAPVVPPEALAALRGTPIVVSVAREGPRAEIRAALARMGFVETRDYLCAA
jgi:cellulose synthase/poly-beta-1,6-N-acetylglucosamine synthase-like glycosyltransferase